MRQILSQGRRQARLGEHSRLPVLVADPNRNIVPNPFETLIFVTGVPQMNRVIRTATFAIVIVLSIASALAQSTQSAQQLAELNSLKEKVKDADTRTRVTAFHRVWTIALSSDDPEVKMLALDLMKEPVASASDHIRMPAVYAIAEIAISTSDTAVKAKALSDFKEPISAGQLPIRDATIDAINSIMCGTTSPDLALEAIQLLGEPLRSGNNGTRIPAINAVTHIALASKDDRVINATIDLMQAPLNSAAMIGGMEVRMMAVAEVEKLGLAASELATKTKTIALLQGYAGNSSWEPEAQRRAAEAATRIQSTIPQTPSPGAAIPTGKLSVSSTPAGADIELDGNFAGNTPSELSVAGGDHTIQIKKAGFAP